jgi:hypothetical protein
MRTPFLGARGVATLEPHGFNVAVLAASQFYHPSRINSQNINPCVTNRGGTSTVGMKYAAPKRPRTDADTDLPLIDRVQEIGSPHAFSSHTSMIDEDVRVESAKVAMTARMAATRSPYAAGLAKADGSGGETTPGTRKLSPTNRNVWGTTSGMSASSPFNPRTRGIM